MNTQIRYQVFVSSTYEDLRAERQQATQAILETENFPSGMELFPASDDSQWELIKRVIQESDYYVVIVGGHYGSLGPMGISYTEMEYDYALETGIPILGFVKDNIDEIPAKYSEKDQDRLNKLLSFREKVKSKTCRLFTDPNELGMAVMKSLMSETRIKPQIGWIRANLARSEKDKVREQKLLEELESAQTYINELEREIRDRSVLIDEIPREKLAQGNDKFEFTVSYRNNKKDYVTENILVSWNDIFKVIGPSIYGYIVNKGKNYANRGSYPFQSNIEDFFRAKIIDKVQSRKIDIQQTQIDACVIQFKELGLLQYTEKEEMDGSIFRGITLTEYGEKQLTLLNITTKEELVN